MSRSKSETAIFSIFLQFFDRIRAVKIGLWDDKMKVDLIRLKNRSKLRFRHTFREKFGVLGLKMVEIGQKSLFLVISDCFLAVSDRKSHKISFSLAKMDSRAHFKIEKRVLRFVSENRFLVIWGLSMGIKGPRASGSQGIAGFPMLSRALKRGWHIHNPKVSGFTGWRISGLQGTRVRGRKGS